MEINVDTLKLEIESLEIKDVIYPTENESKLFVLLKKIINQRKNAVNLIVNSLRKFIKNIKEKKSFLLCKILKERIYFSQIIKSNFKMFISRKKVKKIIQKNKDYFSIISERKNYTSLSLKVIKDDKEVILNFKFCKLRNVFVLYILRALALGTIYRVNFIADGKTIIDPMYRTDYDDKGNFFNIIDFNLIELQERKQKEERLRVVKFYLNQIAKQRKIEEDKISERNSHSSSSSSSEYRHKQGEYETISAMRSSFGYDKTKKLYLKRNSLNIGRSERGLFSRSILNVNLKPTKTMSSLILPLKPILRSANSTRNSLGGKRVSFTSNIEFSY